MKSSRLSLSSLSHAGFTLYFPLSRKSLSSQLFTASLSSQSNCSRPPPSPTSNRSRSPPSPASNQKLLTASPASLSRTAHGLLPLQPAFHELLTAIKMKHLTQIEVMTGCIGSFFKYENQLKIK